LTYQQSYSTSDLVSTGMGDRLRQTYHFGILTKSPMPMQPPTFSLGVKYNVQ